MKKLLLLVSVFAIMGSLFSVHNFTINGQEEVTVSIGDTMVYDFDFESVMGNAGYRISIDIPLLEIPTIEIPFSLFQDGLGYDETGFDGHFTANLECEMSLPSSVPVTIILEDGNVADSVLVHYNQLDTNYSVSGTVLQEGGWIDLPVPSPLVYINYNSDDFSNLELMTCIANFFDPMPEGEYLIMEFGSMLGSYQVYVPDTIPNVECAVNVYSYLDIQGENTQTPPQQVVTVNGHESGINFLYPDLEGGIEGTVEDNLGNPLGYVAFYITMDSNPDFEDYFLTGEDGTFNRGLEDGTYNVSVVALGYDTYEEQVTIDGDYEVLNIVLSPTASNEEIQQAHPMLLSTYPNPFNDYSTLEIVNSKSESVNINIYDVKGRLVENVHNGILNQGINSFKFSSMNYPSGIYFWKVDLNNASMTKKVILVK